MRLKRTIVAVTAALAMTGLSVVASGSSSATPVSVTATTVCGYPSPSWTTSLKNASGLAQGPMTDIDAGTQTCFDRIVVRRVAGEPWPSYDARYVTQASTQATGCRADLGTGNRILRINVEAPNYMDYGTPTTSNALRRNTGPGCESIATPLRTWTNDIHTTSAPISFAGYHSIAQAKWLGSFEGTSSFALGIKGGYKKFRVTLANNHRDLVIDVAK